MVLLAECLMPIERLWPRNGLPDSIVVQTVPVDSNIHQFAILNTALIRDCLMAGGAERLGMQSGTMACASDSCGGWQMVRLITPVTGMWILAAEMAAAGWVAGWSTTVKRYAPLHPPPSQHPIV